MAAGMSSGLVISTAATLLDTACSTTSETCPDSARLGVV